MKDFEPLIGEWHGEGELADPPMKMSAETKVERMGHVFGPGQGGTNGA